MRTVSLILGLLILSAALQTASQNDGVIRINVNLVQVDAVVTDNNGKPVTDLTANDFEVLQDGKRQPITNFAFVNIKARSASRAPVPRAKASRVNNSVAVPPPPPMTLRPDQIRRTVAIIVDDLGLSFDSIVHVREAAKKWVETAMQPGDLVAVVRTSAGMGALQQFTSDKRALLAAIERLQYHFGRVGVSSFGAATGDTSPVDTSKFDAEVTGYYLEGTLGAIHYVVRGLRELPGRKTVILFSESMEHTFQSEDSMRRLVDEANRSSVVISAVDPRGVVYTGPTAEDRGGAQAIAAIAGQRTQQLINSQDGMVVLSEKTGGLFIQSNNDIPAALQQVIDDGDGYYLIGYQPDQATFDERNGPRFHSISVRLKRPGLHVRSRSGFFGAPEARKAPPPATKQQQLVQALSSPFSTGSVHVHLTALFSNAEPQGSIINVLLYIDAHDLSFKDESDGSRSDLIDVAAVTFDADGHQVDGVDRTYRFQIPSEAYQDVLKQGLVYSAHVPIKKAGPYQLRVVVRDDTTQAIGSATQFIEVPDVKKDKLYLSGIMLGADRPQASAAPAAAEGAVAADDPNSTPAVRIFKPGTDMVYAYQILNAHADRDMKPELESQVRLFRDGRQVFSSVPASVSADRQPNPKRLIVTGHIQLKEIPSGDYVMQVVIADKLRNPKDPVATQAIDFQVSPPEASR
jgi:VWFA-related protein